MGRQGKGRSVDRLHHLERRQAGADRRGRGAGRSRPRHPPDQRLAAGAYASQLEPVDDLVNSLIKEYGKVLLGTEYVGKQKGHWVAMPTGNGTTALVPCARIDMMKEYAGLDVAKMYPAGAPPDKALADAWTWDAFLTAAEKSAKAGYPFGLPMSNQSDAVNWVGAVFASHGAELVDQEGKITVNSDATRHVLEWFKKLVPVLPQSVFAWDNAGNNKWLVSGKGALIMNPPSAWAVAVRDAPKIAEQLWTFPAPKGPKGRYDPTNFGFWGIWDFSPNKSAAKSLLGLSVDPLLGRAAGRREPRLRYPALREAARLLSGRSPTGSRSPIRVGPATAG